MSVFYSNSVETIKCVALYFITVSTGMAKISVFLNRSYCLS